MTLTRRTPLAKVSKKRRAQRYDYEQAVAVVRTRDANTCQLAGSDTTCNGPVDPHHVFTQARWPERRCDPDAMVLLCRWHHDWTHGHPKEARKMGLLR